MNKEMFKWQVSSSSMCGKSFYQVWRQTRVLDEGEPMHSGVRDNSGIFDTESEAQEYADKLNSELNEEENNMSKENQEPEAVQVETLTDEDMNKEKRKAILDSDDYYDFAKALVCYAKQYIYDIRENLYSRKFELFENEITRKMILTYADLKNNADETLEKAAIRILFEEDYLHVEDLNYLAEQSKEQAEAYSTVLYDLLIKNRN